MLQSRQIRHCFARGLLLRYGCYAAVGAVFIALAEPADAKAFKDDNAVTLLFRDALFKDAENDPNDPSFTVGGNPAFGDDSESWLRAVIENRDKYNGKDAVKLTLDANLTKESGAFISSVAFNLGMNADIDSICRVTGSGCTNQDFNYSPGSIDMANGIKGLDLELLFPTANNSGSDRLDHYDSFSFIISGDKLDFSSFYNFIDINGQDVYSAARLQGYGGSSTIYSAPGPLPLLGIAAAFRTSRRLRRRLTSARLASGRPPVHRPA
jgi:hypothetical protein